MVPSLPALASAPASADEGAFSTEAAMEVVQRVLPEANEKEVRLVALAPTGKETFRVAGHRGKVTISGTSVSALLRGVTTYLNEVARVDVSWNGDSLSRLPQALPLPTGTIERSANVSHRFALNDTDDGYTGAYRTWKDWENTIDVLALQGIKEVYLPVGAEAVYLETFKEFGYTEQELLGWAPQPEHQPWWLLQNMCCFPSEMSLAVVQERAALGRKIAHRLRELDMVPVLPGYFGTVPPNFAAKNPGANIVPQGGWVGFNRPDWLDPTGPQFRAVAEAFYRHSAALFGDSTMYKMDLLHEGGVAGTVDIGAASKGVETALQTAQPGAIWAILGWQNNPRPETLAAIDTSKMFIVDGLADRYNGLNRESSWRGTPYAFGSIWNFGGHTTMGANMGVWNERYWAWKAKPDSALDGIAVLPEASDNNPVALSFLTALAWADGPTDMDAWFATWAGSRYGGTDAKAKEAWTTIGSTAYAMPAGSWSEAHDGLFAARPSLTARSAATWSPTSAMYDTAAFAQALPALLDVDPQLRTTSAYRYDLVDVARQVMSNRSRDLLPQIKTAYDAKDQAAFGRLTADWLESMRLMEQLTATNTQTMLGPWLADARSWGATAAEADRLEYGARSILTIWGNRSGFDAGLGDYANREWSGLIGTYYLPRWQRYFDELGSALAEARAPKAFDWFAEGDAWSRRTDALPTTAKGDVHSIATAVLEHVRSHPTPLALTVAADRGAVTSEQPAVVTATLTNPNAFTSASNVAISLAPVPGLTVTPVGASTVANLDPGASFRAKFQVALSEPGAATALVSSLTATATYAVGADTVRRSASVRLMTAHGVQAPNQTASFNSAVFGQRGEEFAIEGGGADMWGGVNEFGTIYRDAALTTGQAVTTRVLAQDTTGPWARAGIVVRDDLASQGSRGFLNLAVTPANGCVLSFDANNDGRLETFRQSVSFTAPVHLRLSRNGDTFTGECSTDGESWTQVGSATVAAADASDVGLFMTAAGPTRGVAQFAGFAVTNPPPPAGPGAGTHHLSDLPFASSTSEIGPWERDMHNGETAAGDGGPIRLAGITYAKGLGGNANAEVTFTLGGTCTRFQSLVGIDDTMDRADADGDVEVEVWAGDQRVYASDVISGGEPPRSIDVDTTGAATLRLVVKQSDINNWWDRTDWADARITCS